MTKSDFLYFYDYDHFFSFSQRSVTTPKPVEWELTTNCEWVRNPLVVIQVNLCQKPSFLHQLTQNMTKYCLLNYKFSTIKLQVHQIDFFLFVSEQFDLYNMAQHVRNLQFSHTNLMYSAKATKFYKISNLLLSVCHYVL